jgi:hypothetical protein
MLRIMPIANKEIIRYRKTGKKVVDTFTNQLLYEGNRAKEVFKKINTIGMYNANILDTGSQAKMKLMYIA